MKKEKRAGMIGEGMDPFVSLLFYAIFFSTVFAMVGFLLRFFFRILFYFASCPFPYACFSRLGCGRRLQEDGKRWDGSGTNGLRDRRGVEGKEKKKGRKGEKRESERMRDTSNFTNLR